METTEVTVVLWTKQARADLAAIRAFISEDSPHYAWLSTVHHPSQRFPEAL